jgi:hypothetical protein
MRGVTVSRDQHRYCRVFPTLAIDLVGRDYRVGANTTGKTKTQPRSAEHDLSLATLTADLMSLIRHVYPDPGQAPALLVSLSTGWPGETQLIPPKADGPLNGCCAHTRDWSSVTEGRL